MWDKLVSYWSLLLYKLINLIINLKIIKSVFKLNNNLLKIYKKKTFTGTSVLFVPLVLIYYYLLEVKTQNPSIPLKITFSKILVNNCKIKPKG